MVRAAAPNRTTRSRVVSARARTPPRPARRRRTRRRGRRRLLPAARRATAPAGATTTTTAAAATTTTAPTWVEPARDASRLRRWWSPPACRWKADRILFTYDLSPHRAPRGRGPRRSLRSLLAAAAPASFTLTYPGGTTSARALGPGQRAGRFEVPAGVTTAEVQAITIDSYWVPVPGGYTIELSPSSGAWVPAAPGVRARILQVVEQAENRLVIVELEGDAILADDLAIAGEGRDWQSSSYSQIGGLRWTLDFRGEALPDPVAWWCGAWAGSRCAGGGARGPGRGAAMSDDALREVLRSPLDDLPPRSRPAAGCGAAALLVAAGSGSGSSPGSGPSTGDDTTATTEVTTSTTAGATSTTAPGRSLWAKWGSRPWPPGARAAGSTWWSRPPSSRARIPPRWQGLPERPLGAAGRGGDLVAATAELSRPPRLPGCFTLEFPATDLSGGVELLAYPAADIIERHLHHHPRLGPVPLVGSAGWGGGVLEPPTTSAVRKWPSMRSAWTTAAARSAGTSPETRRPGRRHRRRHLHRGGRRAAGHRGRATCPPHLVASPRWWPAPAADRTPRRRGGQARPTKRSPTRPTWTLMISGRRRSGRQTP